jgi:hypothetical protein
MSDPERVAQLEANLARDNARLQEIDRLESNLLQRIPEEGCRAVAEGIRFRSERESLADKIFKARILLADAKR